MINFITSLIHFAWSVFLMLIISSGCLFIVATWAMIYIFIKGMLDNSLENDSDIPNSVIIKDGKITEIYKND